MEAEREQFGGRDEGWRGFETELDVFLERPGPMV